MKQPKAGPKGEGQDARSQEHMGGTVAQRMFQFMDHQAIAIDTQPLQGDWPSRHVTAQALKFVTLMNFTHDCSVEGKALTRGRQRLGRWALAGPLDGIVQSHGLATGNRTHANAVTYRGAGQLFEGTITPSVRMDVEPGQGLLASSP